MNSWQAERAFKIGLLFQEQCERMGCPHDLGHVAMPQDDGDLDYLEQRIQRAAMSIAKLLDLSGARCSLQDLLEAAHRVGTGDLTRAPDIRGAWQRR
jgi:hypothetical protein